MIQTKVVEKIKTHILCSITFFRKSCRLHKIQPDRPHMTSGAENIQGYKETNWKYLIIICFSTANMFTWTLLNITLYVYCLACFSILPASQSGIISNRVYVICLRPSPVPTSSTVTVVMCSYTNWVMREPSVLTTLYQLAFITHKSLI